MVAIDRGNIDQAAVPDAFPQIDKDQNPGPCGGSGIPIDSFFPKGRQNGVIDNARLLAQESVNDVTENH